VLQDCVLVVGFQLAGVLLWFDVVEGVEGMPDQALQQPASNRVVWFVGGVQASTRTLL
jgi:hypothetical protein